MNYKRKSSSIDSFVKKKPRAAFSATGFVDMVLAEVGLRTVLQYGLCGPVDQNTIKSAVEKLQVFK